MTEETSKNYAKASLERAEKALKSAKLLQENGEHEDAASRAYYAMFHAARAILFNKGISAKTHRGTISIFGEKIVKQRILSEEYADMLRKAFDLRQKSDYELYTELNAETVKEAIKNAEKFIKKAKELTKAQT
jgi:hypothetical protein